MLELGRRALHDSDRLLEQREAALATLDEARRAQGPGERTRSSPGAGVLHLLCRQLPGLVRSFELQSATAAGERQAMKAGLTAPTSSKLRPASRSCSAPPAGSPRRMRSRALL